MQARRSVQEDRQVHRHTGVFLDQRMDVLQPERARPVGQVERRRPDDIPVRHQANALGRVLGHVPQGHNDIFAQRRRGQVAGGQETSQGVRLVR